MRVARQKNRVQCRLFGRGWDSVDDSVKKGLKVRRTAFLDWQSGLWLEGERAVEEFAPRVRVVQATSAYRSLFWSNHADTAKKPARDLHAAPGLTHLSPPRSSVVHCRSSSCSAAAVVRAGTVPPFPPGSNFSAVSSYRVSFNLFISVIRSRRRRTEQLRDDRDASETFWQFFALQWKLNSRRRCCRSKEAAPDSCQWDQRGSDSNEVKFEVRNYLGDVGKCYREHKRCKPTSI